ncbi:acyl-CoA-binding domain-containing protein 6 [Episyrphus balteatus]|uniref:acyl-CoA-binding domain-containing protein 6 n=1 Tax=Episyrphus balteatus TaxID=286459 RepID=UPI0024852F65|nr:acyl-CoA-binding domain-containing protein 6 [Episyrphus balteatus]
MSDFSDSDSDTDLNFNSAAEAVQKIHTQLSAPDLLELYGLYKQSTCGKCNIPKPGIFQAQARSKWSAWNSLGEMDQKEARRLYTEKISRLDPNWQAVDKSKLKTGWVVHSVHANEEEQIDEDNKTPFDYVKENNLSGLKRILVKDSINNLDKDSGMGLIHWATDRNAGDLLEYLLSSGANVNLQDSDGQSCLHYAASCGHFDCLRILIKFGADKDLRDNEGAIALEVADDENIRKLLES